MRRMLHAIAILGVLAIGCVDDRAQEVERPGPTVAAGRTTPTSPRPSSTATRPPEESPARETPTPPARTPEQACTDLADGYRRGRPTERWLTLSPPAPSGDRPTRITGSGLQPGDYSVSVGVPQTDYGVGTLGPVASVGTDGKLDVTLTVPAIKGCLGIVIRQQSTHGESTNQPGARAESLPFFSTGTSASTRSPRACDELPSEVWGGYGGRLASISEGPYRVGTPVTVSADLRPWPIATELDVEFSLVNGKLPSPKIEAYADVLVREWDADGRARLSFAPRANPALSGLCVEVSFTLQPIGGLGHPYAVTRFTYP